MSLNTKTESSFPLITIGICCYNSEDTVERAINSALNQDWPNLELLIVDDGSSDKTPEIIKEKIKDTTKRKMKGNNGNKAQKFELDLAATSIFRNFEKAHKMLCSANELANIKDSKLVTHNDFIKGKFSSSTPPPATPSPSGAPSTAGRNRALRN